MLHLLLADDRQDIVERIGQAIDCPSMELELFTAYNGQDAYDIMQNVQIDILVTDIKMPYMSGIELIEKCSRENYRCKYILISGYDDFNYAKQAIHLSVSEYLLKPIQLEDLIKAIETVKAQILVEQQLEHSLNKIRSHEQQLHSISKNDCFESIICKGNAISRDAFAELNLHTTPHDLYLLTIDIHHTDTILEQGGISELNLMKYALSNIAEEIFATDFFCDDFTIQNNQLILVLSAKNKLRDLQAQYKLYELSDVLQNTFQQHFNLQLSIAISEHYLGGDALYRAYTESHNFISTIYQKATSEILLESEWKAAAPDEPYPSRYRMRLLQSICLGDSAQIESNVNELCNYIEAETQAFKAHHITELSHLIAALYESQAKDPCIAKVTQQLQQITYFDALRAFLLETMLQIGVSALPTSTARTMEQEMRRVQKYLEENYHRNISLKEIAETLYLSQSYISTSFKEIIGINFNTYLTNLRIDRAKQLLLNNQYKIYQIAEQVGYHDAKYFSEIFRKATGLLPKDWYKQNRL